MNRSPLIALTLLMGAPSLEAQTDAVQTAERAGMAAIQGPLQALTEVLDADGILERHVGMQAWRAMTERQRGILRSALRDRFAGMLAPPRPVRGGIAWSAALPAGPGGNVDVLLGLRLADKTLKSRWRMRREGPRWLIDDVILSDPGISLAGTVLSSLEARPVRREETLRQARTRILPWLASLVVIGLTVLLATPRLSPSGRRVLSLAVVVAGLVLAVSGAIVAVRIAGERYAIRVGPAAEPWRRSQELAVAAEREGRTAQARDLSARAIALGSPPGPAALEMGLAARDGGDAEAARGFFERALAAPAPAPGALRELSGLDAAAGRFTEAESRLGRYLEIAGPDPDALSLQAVLLTNLGKTAQAVDAIRQARRLVGEGTQGAELEAKIRARAADAAGAVAALRPLTREGGLDREGLRSDPAYLPIATDPIWVGFLDEK